MSIKAKACRSMAAIRGLRRVNHHYAMPTTAECMRISSAKAAAPEVYDAWLKGQISGDPRGHALVTGVKLRRAVLMRRSGSSTADVRALFGPGMLKWIKRLPPELAA